MHIVITMIDLLLHVLATYLLEGELISSWDVRTRLGTQTHLAHCK